MLTPQEIETRLDRIEKAVRAIAGNMPLKWVIEELPTPSAIMLDDYVISILDGHQDDKKV